MFRTFLILAAFSAMTAVLLGAFGAHGLRATLSAYSMSVYHTAVNYHMWHALGLGLVALLARHYPASKLLLWSGWLLFGGIVIFSGSLYILAVSGFKWLGMITPLGGLAFIIGWLLVVLFAVKLDRDESV